LQPPAKLEEENTVRKSTVYQNIAQDMEAAMLADDVSPPSCAIPLPDKDSNFREKIPSFSEAFTDYFRTTRP